MNCRRCGESIADGSDNCPVCGISQHTYITPRNHNIKLMPKKRSPKSVFISIVAMAVAVAGVMGMLYLSDKETTKKDYQTVLDAYEEGDETKLWLAVGHFKKNHPNSPLVEEVNEYYERLVMGDDYYEEVLESTPEDASAREEKARLEALERLKATARDQIVAVDNITLQEPLIDDSRDMIVVWRNTGGEEISEIRFSFEAYNAQGKPTSATASGESKIMLSEKKYGAPNGDGTPYESIWLDVWHGDEIDHVKLIRVRITYKGEEGKTVTLPQEVCELLLP